MKRKYLGDSRDSFKWDYHDYLASELHSQRLTVALMLTPDDTSRDGETKPEQFPAGESVLKLCTELRHSRDIAKITLLPVRTGASYEVTLHKGESPVANRADYFSGIDRSPGQIVFIDPDNGFEPERSCTNQHVGYRDVDRVLEQVHGNSVVSVFQYFRRIPFPVDFARIRVRLGHWPCTAICWHSVMFVAIARETASIDAVRAANARYRATRPVRTVW